MVALSNDYGNTVEIYEYDVYGYVVIQDQSYQPRDTSQFGNPYMFTGRRFDTETGLYYYRARMYNPYIGRFLQTDPIGYEDSMNLYTYVGNNPIVLVDPWGLCGEGSDNIPWNILIGGSGTAGAVLGGTAGAQYVFNLGGEDGIYLHGGGGPYVGVGASGMGDFSVMYGQPSDLSGGSSTYGGSGTVGSIAVGGEIHIGEAIGITVSAGFGTGPVSGEGHLFIEGSKFIPLSEIIPTLNQNTRTNRAVYHLGRTYGTYESINY